MSRRIGLDHSGLRVLVALHHCIPPWRRHQPPCGASHRRCIPSLGCPLTDIRVSRLIAVLQGFCGLLGVLPRLSGLRCCLPVTTAFFSSRGRLVAVYQLQYRLLLVAAGSPYVNYNIASSPTPRGSLCTAAASPITTVSSFAARLHCLLKSNIFPPHRCLGALRASLLASFALQSSSPPLLSNHRGSLGTPAALLGSPIIEALRAPLLPSDRHCLLLSDCSLSVPRGSPFKFLRLFLCLVTSPSELLSPLVWRSTPSISPCPPVPIWSHTAVLRLR